MYVKKIKSISKSKVEAGRKTSFQVLISSQEGPNFAMRKFTIEPGGNMPLHTNSVEHEQYVLHGRALVKIADQAFEVEEGDIVFIPSGVLHSYKTIGNEPFGFLCLVPNKEDKIKIAG